MDRPVEYVIVDEEDLDAEARRGGVRIGYIRCVVDGNRLVLCDIVVDEAERGLGVGSTLLKTVLREAEVRGIHETWGSVTADDLRRTPHLLAWYERHGFAAEAPDKDCVRGAVKKVVRGI